MLRGFLRRHRQAEEVAAASVGLDLVWAALRYLGVFAAGAAIASLTTTTPPAVRVQVPFRLAAETPIQKQLVRFAYRYGPGSGIVYVWGGDGPFGFDCSGYVNYLYRRAGILIPRDSRSQWTSLTGSDVAKGHEQPGDAVYFQGDRSGPNAGPPPGHEGIYIGGGRFIEYYASGLPAHVASLRDAAGYMGAKRWWRPVTVQRRVAATVFWFARYFHVRVASSERRSVGFVPSHGRMFPLWRYTRMVRWARHHARGVWGTRHQLHVRF